MSMIKVVSPHGWDWGEPVARLIKASNQGLTGDDRREFLKYASPAFVHEIDSAAVREGEEPIHVIGLGATEAYGANRNGDGFKVAACREYHPTFEKFAKWYRHHKNDDPKLSYGRVIKSAYNEQMKRVELLIGLNATKEAARRNDGYVADKELEKLARGEDIPVSMSCRVSYDVCSNCGNRAPSRAHYCDEDNCIGPRGEKRGGCKHNLARVFEDGHILHVDNPEPAFFDMSHVFRGADRTAFAHPADYLQKAASLVDDQETLAQGLNAVAPLDVVLFQDARGLNDPHITGQVKLAYALAELERREHPLSEGQLWALSPAVAPSPSDQWWACLGKPGTPKAAEALGALADHKILLPLDVFARWLDKAGSAAHEASSRLPRLFQDFVADGDVPAKLATSAFAPARDSAPSTEQRVLARKLAAHYGFDVEAVRDRAMRSRMRGVSRPTMKQAADTTRPLSPEAAQLLGAYAMYKIAALHRAAANDPNLELTARFCLGQNRV